MSDGRGPLGVRVTELERSLEALAADWADKTHPLAAQHRYELASELRALAERVAQLEVLVTAWLSDAGEDWKA